MKRKSTRIWKKEKLTAKSPIDPHIKKKGCFVPIGFNPSFLPRKMYDELLAALQQLTYLEDNQDGALQSFPLYAPLKQSGIFKKLVNFVKAGGGSNDCDVFLQYVDSTKPPASFFANRTYSKINGRVTDNFGTYPRVLLCNPCVLL